MLFRVVFIFPQSFHLLKKDRSQIINFCSQNFVIENSYFKMRIVTCGSNRQVAVVDRLGSFQFSLKEILKQIFIRCLTNTSRQYISK